MAVPAELGDERRRRLRVPLGRHVGDDDRGARLGEHAAGGGADGASPADDEGNFALKGARIGWAARLGCRDGLGCDGSC